MNLLLDTHALLWFLNDEPLLSATAKGLIEDPANRKFVSIATCWEIAIKVGVRKLDLGEPATTFLPRELASNLFDLLEINATCDLHRVAAAASPRPFRPIAGRPGDDRIYPDCQCGCGLRPVWRQPSLVAAEAMVGPRP